VVVLRVISMQRVCDLRDIGERLSVFTGYEVPLRRGVVNYAIATMHHRGQR
jgi:hypothetical protein